MMKIKNLEKTIEETISLDPSKPLDQQQQGQQQGQQRRALQTRWALFALPSWLLPPLGRGGLGRQSAYTTQPLR